MLKSTVLDSALDRLFALELAGLVLLPDHGPRMYHRRVCDAFSRDSAVAGTLARVDAAATVDFELPATAVDFLRFDLPAIAGCYRMGPVVVDGCEVENLSRRVMAVHGRRLPDPDSAAEIRLAEWIGAPWFELDVRDLWGGRSSPGPAGVRITVRKENGAIEMERRLDLAVVELAKQLKEQTSTIGSTVAEAAASLALAQRSSENQVCQVLVETSTRLDQLNADTAHSLAAMGSKVDAAALASDEYLQRHFSDAAAQAEALQQELANLRQRVDVIRSQVDFLLHYEINRSLVRRALRKVKKWVGK